MFQVRMATPERGPHLVQALDAYLQETFGQPWNGSRETLRRDGFGAEFETIIIAETVEGQLIGFAAWRFSYDLHHCNRGGEILDLFVRLDCRGRGVAVALLAAVAAEVQRRDGEYLKGQAVENAVARHLYERMAICFPGASCIVGGRAFRRLAELSGRDGRELARGLPQKSWNYEP